MGGNSRCLKTMDQQQPDIPQRTPLFLSVKPGMTVVVTEEDSWWMGDVLFMEGGARNPKVPTLFQIACIDTGTIRWVNADLVTHIVPAV